MAKKMTKKKKRTVVIITVLAIFAVAAAVVTFLRPDDRVQVELVTASKQSIDSTLDTTGTVTPASEDAFVLPSGVKVTSLNVKEGDMVKAGDVLATFDTSSLQKSLDEKESAYEKAQAAYNNALTQSKQSKTKIADLKKQIADVERKIAELKSKESETSIKPAGNSTDKTKPTQPAVKVSDTLVKRFRQIAKLMGIEYSDEQARKMLTNLLSSGASLSDLSSMMDSLNSLANSSGSFDMSSLANMGASGSMSLEVSLVQLKAQLSTLEIQSGDTYISAYKTIAEKTKEAYISAQAQMNSMKKGWVAAAKGIVSEVNLDENGEAQSDSSAAQVDISSVLSAVTSGGDFSALLTSFLNDGKTAVKVLYYPLVADISLSKYDVLNVNLNQKVKITSANGIEHEGRVSYISAVATSGSGININSIMGTSSSASTTVIPAQVTIDNADSSIIVGVDVDVSIVTQTAENVVVVPVEAVNIDGTDVFVYTYDEDSGKAVRKDIKLGISDDTYYQVLSGVSENDVLIKNTSGLEDGVKVKVK